MTITLNPNDKGAEVVLSLGNLHFDFTYGGENRWLCRATKGVSSGKHYWEMLATAADQYTPVAGITLLSQSINEGSVGNACGGCSIGGRGYIDNGVWYDNATNFAKNDVLGFCLDCTAKTLLIKKNNVDLRTLSFSFSGDIYPAIGNYGGSGGNGTMRFAASAFSYAPPTGFNPYELVANHQCMVGGM